MNKTYPVVLYPKNILKFLAINPTPAISSYQPTANHAAGAKITQKISWFVLPKWQLIGAVVVGIILAWSLAFLSPFWLVATGWFVILLGVLSIEIPSKEQSFKKQKVIPSNQFSGLNSDSDGGVSRQLAGKLLTWMQERTSQVLVMATVNRLEFLPPELIRRFDDIVFVDIPHTGARYEIFKLHLAKYFPGLDFSERDWWRLLRETKMLTPAEIGNLVRKTAEEAFYRNAKQFTESELSRQPLNVTVKDFLEQRYNFTPSMIREEDKIVEIRNKASYARPASSPDKSRWRQEPEVLFGVPGGSGE